MPSFEERFYLQDPGLWQGVRRNLRLLAMLGGALWGWCTTGWRLRRALRRAKRRGEVIFLEDLLE